MDEEYREILKIEYLNEMVLRGKDISFDVVDLMSDQELEDGIGLLFNW